MNLIKRILLSSFVLTLVGTSVGANAKAYKTVLVHGFQSQQLTAMDPRKIDSDGEAYWAEYWGGLADERIDWPSYERVEGKIASDYLWPKLRTMSEQGVCQPGCIFLTHSTGDLITRYIIDNQANWLENAGLEPLNIVATFDVAGAGGGSELADLAVNVANGLANPVVEAAVRAWLGRSVGQTLGVLNDLKVNNARQIASFPGDRTPRLRFVADGDLYFNATKLFLPGIDDSVVAAHSACGANQVAAFDSCSVHVGMDGKLTSQDDGVRHFLPYHYPMLMSDNYDHYSVILNQAKGKVTTANTSINVAPNKSVAFSTYEEEKGFWLWKKKYRYVRQSDNTSMSALLFAAIPE
ncbi:MULTISPECIES: hypothetical protein [Pseudoalteromonas]|uniref:Uncharacterized protein n=1 Tax=Pseudoalteromonas luteoviolacea (strain 2ta16) TaxID=1353533 RepID=V4H147_PSEL2|nr:hypothetical protein [Pseudoalteromonas luteoviolacea]ESP91171.1 hypothetical protein PL2TA16_01178 [Pseudoalteromonas luteoviolacea 2ta16]KZN41296.1 hypothetical protein N483_15485 [Pseudoalteromonas luteoviolacea NCIMB 1944]MCG7550225.1 hypothetical protein [Pseudoalteromonas sp. Of7M-16]